MKKIKQKERTLTAPIIPVSPDEPFGLGDDSRIRKVLAIVIGIMVLIIITGLIALSFKP